MRKLFHDFFRSRSKANGLALFCAVLVGLVGSEVSRHRAEKQYQLQLGSQVQKVLLKLESETMRSSAMAVAELLGLNEPMLKQQARGRRQPDDPSTLARLHSARSMLHADGIYIMDRKGLVVAHAAEKDHFTGLNFSFRPYWQQAMHGIKNVYPAVGTVSGKRGLYVAAPIRAGEKASDAPIGVVVIKVSGEYLDGLFGSFDGKLLMLSPQGVVFASSDSDWLYRPALRLSAQNLEAIKARKQFGPGFEKEGANLPPLFDGNDERVVILGQTYAKAIAPLQLNDPAGKWSLVLLSPTHRAFSTLNRFGSGVLYGGVVWIVFILGIRAVRYSAARQDALTRSEETAKALQVAVELKERHAQFTERMQKARDIAAMSAIFFEELARFTPLHQGSLYFLETDEADESALILAGSYGTAYLPARIALGEGLMGQCAVDHQVKVLTDVPDGFWRISSGMGMAMPHALLMMPVRSGEHFIGVVEVASLSADFDQARQLIDTMMPSLAMNLEILIAEKRTQHMLAEAQTNADTYMAWQEIGRQGENWLHALVDQGQDGMLVTDEDGRITFSNRAMENMLGYDKAALRGMALEKILLPPQQGASLEVPALLQGASDGSRGLAPWRNGFRLLRHDETMLAVSLALSRLPGMGLHDPGLCLVCRRA